MAPTWLNYLAARGFEISNWVGSVVVTAAIAWAAAPTVMPPTSGADVWWYALAVVAGFPLGWFLGGLSVGPFVNLICERVNGTPFRTGEHVCILVGKHRGRVARIYEEWPSRHQVRLELGEQAKVSVTDVFGYCQICRASADAMAHGEV